MKVGIFSLRCQARPSNAGNGSGGFTRVLYMKPQIPHHRHMGMTCRIVLTAPPALPAAIGQFRKAE